MLMNDNFQHFSESPKKTIPLLQAMVIFSIILGGMLLVLPVMMVIKLMVLLIGVTICLLNPQLGLLILIAFELVDLWGWAQLGVDLPPGIVIKLFGGMIMLSWLFKKGLSSLISSLKAPRTLLLTGFFLFLSTSIFYSFNIIGTHLALRRFFMNIIWYLIIISVIDSESTVRKVAWTLVITMMITSGVLLVNRFFGGTMAGERLQGPMGNANTLAMFNVAILPTALFFVSGRENNR